MTAALYKTGLGKDEEEMLETAADWLVVLTSGKATESEIAQLMEWRETDARHDAAFRHVANVSGFTRLIRNDRPGIDRRVLFSGAFAVFLTGAASYGLVRPPLGLWPSLSDLTADRRTGPGQRNRFTPTSGVSVEMNSKTSIALGRDGAALRLITGEALISAQAPFEITAGNVTANARAAVFNARHIDREVAITCSEGTLTCRYKGESAELAAGERLRVGADSRIQRERVDVATVTAWQTGLLVFKAAPLSEVIRQINQYRSGDIVLTNSEIANLSVNGVFYTDQTDNAVDQIQQLLRLKVRRLPGGVILLS